MTRATRLAPPVFVLLGTGGALLAWGVHLAAHGRRLGGEVSAQQAEQLVLVAAGVGMVLVATGSMLGAAIVLLVTKPKLLRGVLIQGVAPLVTIVAILVS